MTKLKRSPLAMPEELRQRLATAVRHSRRTMPVTVLVDPGEEEDARRMLKEMRAPKIISVRVEPNRRAILAGRRPLSAQP